MLQRVATGALMQFNKPPLVRNLKLILKAILKLNKSLTNLTNQKNYDETRNDYEAYISCKSQ